MAAAAALACLLLAAPAAAWQLWARHQSAQHNVRAVTPSRSLSQMAVAQPPSSLRTDLQAQIGKSLVDDTVDEEAMIAASEFPLDPETLIGLAKAYLLSLNGVHKDNVEWYADDFRFVGPVVGPLDKQALLTSFARFDIKSAFPDLKSNLHHFRVCPFEPNRVWFSVKYVGTNTEPFLGREATNGAVESPVQAHSIMFNEKGEVTKLTIGYVLDRDVGNTGGIGGFYGLLYAIGRGLPFPEAQPYKKSFGRRLFDFITRVTQSRR